MSLLCTLLKVKTTPEPPSQFDISSDFKKNYFGEFMILLMLFPCLSTTPPKKEKRRRRRRRNICNKTFFKRAYVKGDVQVLGLAGPNSGALVERLTDQQDWPFLQARQVKLYSCKLDRWVDHEHVQKAVSFQLFWLTIGFE